MFLSRVTLTPEDPRALLSLIGNRIGPNDPSFAHKMVWTLFADDEKKERDFLFEVTRRRPFEALIRSHRQPVDAIGCWRVETIPFQPTLTEGQHLRFDLTAVAAKWELVKGAKRGRVVDVVNAEWHAMPKARREVLTKLDVADVVGREWLEAQGEKHGFEPIDDDTTIVSYDGHSFPNKGRKPIKFGSLKFTGTLTVTDPAAFREMLALGIGRQRGFGFGMMQIAPA